VPAETGIAVAFLLSDIAITTAPPAAVTVGAPLPDVVVALSSAGAPCCQVRPRRAARGFVSD